ncbi:MAG: hypothetical protein M3081_22850 [Gemmatimonadota bacterium]|nr:hypothetical protein [Gemmatimonadota bacterium]
MTRYFRRGRAACFVALAAAPALTIASCSTDRLLEVQTPDQITVDKVNSPAGAQAQRVAALGNFSTFLGGDVSGSGVGLNVASGMLADEIISARGGTEHIDSRAQNDASFPSTAWTWVGQTSTQIIRAITALNKFPPAGTVKATQIGQLYALQGYTLLITGEIYCNGVPIGSGDDSKLGSTTYSNIDLFNKAIPQFDSALATLGAADVNLRYLARVGKARALVALAKTASLQADLAAAAAVVKAGGDGAGSSAVPTNFVYNVEYSKTSIVNAVYDWMVATPNFGPSDKEGTNGLDFVSSRDPRIPISRNTDGTPKVKAGQDATPIFTTTIYPTGDAPLPLATGIEARLIEAEAALAASDPVTYLAKLNEPRLAAGYAALPDPGTSATRLDLLFRERAFWFYLTAHRVGDLRRLIRVYGRNAETVFPTGGYFKGGAYGTDVNLKPSQAEQNNPNWKACTDRNA